MSPRPRVRRVRPEEHDVVGAITLAAYADFVTGTEDHYVAHLLDTATRDTEAEVWVATDDADDVPLGSVTICPPGSAWRELAGDGEGEFRMLAVAPDAQGRGVGATLTTFVLDRFRSDGCHAVVLSSLPEMTSAHRVYQRHGFVRTPERDWDPTPETHLLAFRCAL